MNSKAIVKWRCSLCNKKGQVEIKLPILVDSLYSAIEDSHIIVNAYVQCPIWGVEIKEMIIR